MKNLAISMYIRGTQGVKGLWKREDGMGMVEIALIIIVIIALAIVFKDRITELVGDLFDGYADQYSELID